MPSRVGLPGGVQNERMTDRAEALLREALTLPPEERADVAAELLASLDETDPELIDIEAAWAAEIEKRARRVLAGGRPVFHGMTSGDEPKPKFASSESRGSI